MTGSYRAQKKVVNKLNGTISVGEVPSVREFSKVDNGDKVDARSFEQKSRTLPSSREKEAPERTVRIQGDWSQGHNKS